MSRRPEEILEEIKRLVNYGVKEVTLLARCIPTAKSWKPVAILLF
jgi:tRNA A37 methylthiotransferase MiaB